MKKFSKGFTLLEILIVVAIIAALSALVFANYSKGKSLSALARAEDEMKTMEAGIELYKADNNGEWPPDANRGIPPGIEKYVEAEGSWPTAPWPGSVYDYDNWTDPVTGQKIYQISIRFCPASGPLSACRFPTESWAANFGVNSSVYYCLQGACRAHINESVDYPGYCVNCDVE